MCSRPCCIRQCHSKYHLISLINGTTYRSISSHAIHRTVIPPIRVHILLTEGKNVAQMHNAWHVRSDRTVADYKKELDKNPAWVPPAVMATNVLVQNFDPTGQLSAYMKKSLELGKGILSRKPSGGKRIMVRKRYVPFVYEKETEVVNQRAEALVRGKFKGDAMLRLHPAWFYSNDLTALFTGELMLSYCPRSMHSTVSLCRPKSAVHR